MFRFCWTLLIFLFIFECDGAATNEGSTEKVKVDLQTYLIPPSDDSQQIIESSTAPENSVGSNNVTNASDARNGTTTPQQQQQQQQQQQPQQPIPQDPVQQYVNPFGGPYFPPGYPYSPHNYVIPPSWAQYLSQANIPMAFAPIQTEYEGILVPLQSQPPPIPPPPVVPQEPHQEQIEPEAIERAPKLKQANRINTDMIVLLRNLLPPNLIHLIITWGSLVMNAFSIIALGGLITTAICSLTPICSITFGALPLASALRANFGIGKDVGTEATIARVRRATEIFSSALDKYEQLQKFSVQTKAVRRN